MLVEMYSDNELAIMVRYEPIKAIYLAIKHSPFGLTSRQELRRRLKLSTVTVMKYVEMMIVEGLIEERQFGNIKALSIKEDGKPSQVQQEGNSGDVTEGN
jgi:predicted transcriptional regulator